MKQFVYQVGAHEFIGAEAFGQAWKDAKAKAAELHMPIYREVREIRREVYTQAGFFMRDDTARPENIKVF